MPAKGHKSDCQCAICKRMRAKEVRLATAEPVVETLDVYNPSDTYTKPEFRLGQQVTVIRPVRGVPTGISTTVEGFGNGKIKIVYRKKFLWVSPEDISHR